MLSLWNPIFPVVKEKSDSRISTKNYFDRLFEDTFATMTHDLFSNSWPLIDFDSRKNEDGSLSISIDVPGIKEENIDIEIQDNIINIKGNRKTNKSSYSINKSFNIPEGYSSDDIKAELSDGVLTLTLINMPVIEKEKKKIPIISSIKQIK